ncbi:MAG: hypothetical protein JWP87_3537 [Labilithrix sp.]|nr:hypothetical protein [Labilithrix sp.]
MIAPPCLLRRAAAVASVLASTFAAAFAASCLRIESYVYTAQKYDPTADCVHAYAPIERVSGSGASSLCPATCFTVGDDLYVSTMCPPLPTIASEVEANDSACIAAIAAAAGRGTCEAPGEAGAGEPDGGGDAGEGEEAGEKDAEPADSAPAAQDAPAE